MNHYTKESRFMKIFKYYMEGDEVKYKFSVIKSLKNIPLLLVVLFILSFVEIICIEFNIGIKLLNNNVLNIIENICYAYLTSFVFYYFVEILPITKKQFYYNKIIKRKIRILQRNYDSLNTFIHGGIVLDSIGSKLVIEKLECDNLYERLDKINNWKNNLQEMKHLFDNIVLIIKEIINYNNLILGENLFDKLDYVYMMIDTLGIEKYYEIDENIYEKKKFVEMFVEIYLEIMEQLESITKDYKKSAN